jgi:6-phosphogluconolactonase (cycloisomerase 2 family)
MVSNRLDNSSTYKCNPATGNGISCASDTLTTFRPTFNELDGSMKLELVQMHAAGGSKPRHIAFNKAGDLVAVALEDSNTISIIARNVRSGLLTEFMTIQRVADRPNMVLWDEL